jgi:hypothetical protein
MVSNLFYLGEVFGCISIARVPDLMGRKWPFFWSIAIQLPVLIAIIFSRSLDFTIFLGFLMGFLHIGIYNGGYVNVCEYVHNPWKNHVCTILLVFDMLTTILIGVYFHYVSRYWLWFCLVGVAFNAISLVGIFLIPESPEYLYCFYKFGECREIVLKIAEWNSMPLLPDWSSKKRIDTSQSEIVMEGDFNNKNQKDSTYVDGQSQGGDSTLKRSRLQLRNDKSQVKSKQSMILDNFKFDVENDLRNIRFSRQIADGQDNYMYSIVKGNEYRKSIEIQTSVKAGIREFFKERDLVINLILCMALWAVTLMTYMINAYYANYFPGDQFQNLIMISTVELVAYILSGIAFEKFSSKKSTKLFIVSFIITIAGALSIILNDKDQMPYLDMIGNFVCKFGLASAYQGVYLVNILFPIVFASTTFGVCCLMGAVSSFFSQDVYGIPGNTPWIVCIGLCFVGIMLALAIRDKN